MYSGKGAGFTQVCRCTLAHAVTGFLFFCCYTPPSCISFAESQLPFTSQSLLSGSLSPSVVVFQVISVFVIFFRNVLLVRTYILSKLDIVMYCHSCSRQLHFWFTGRKFSSVLSIDTTNPTQQIYTVLFATNLT